MLVVRPDICTGCRLCEVTCSWVKEKEFNPARSRIYVQTWSKESLFFPQVCQECEKPACIPVCRPKAITRDEKGIVKIDAELCDGCKDCMIACPNGAIRIDPVTKKMVKCDLCGGDPQCVKWCRTKAIDWVKVDRASMVLGRKLAEKMVHTSRGATPTTP